MKRKRVWSRDSLNQMGFPMHIRDKIEERYKDYLILNAETKNTGFLQIHPFCLFASEIGSLIATSIRYYKDEVITQHLLKVYDRIKPKCTEKMVIKLLRQFNPKYLREVLELNYPEMRNNPDSQSLLLRLKLLL